jgi:hypothetical protein
MTAGLEYALNSQMFRLAVAVQVPQANNHDREVC